MLGSVLASALAPAALAAATLAASPAAPAAGDPVTGVRSITTARGSVTPECLAIDPKGRVIVAAMCFKEGEPHTWSIKAVPAAAGAYVLASGRDCLTLDPPRAPHMLVLPCTRDDLRQVWQIAQRGPGEYQIAQGTDCVQARTGEAVTAPCGVAKDVFGKDVSGQAWKILKDPESVVPDPSPPASAQPGQAGHAGT